MARAKKEVAVPSHDELTSVIFETVNGMYKEKDIAYKLSNTHDEVTDWIPTGCTPLDIAISNRPYGGIPLGRITEILGWEASGKTLLGIHILANVQKMGGIAVYIDTEFSLDTTFARAVGLDLEHNFIYIQTEFLEEAYDAVERIITTIKKTGKKQPVAIMIDSLAAATTKVEAESTFEKDGWATAKAIINSKAMRKITGLISKERVALVLVNQLRDKLGVTFGDASTSSGGKAVGFHASVRITLKNVGKIKKGEDMVGVTTNAFLKKNKVGPPYRTASFNILFDSGIDDYSSWFKIGVEAGVIKTGAWNTIVNTNTGEEQRFRTADFDKLLNDNAPLKESLYQNICDHIITKYRTVDTPREELTEALDENE